MNDQQIAVDVETLQGLEPISSLSVDRIKELATKISVEVLSPDTKVFEEGEDDRAMVYLLEGELMLQSSHNSKPTYITGGMPESWHPVANRHPRQMTATSTSTAEVIRIDIDEFDRMLSWDQMAASNSNADESGDHSIVKKQDAASNMTQSATFQNLPPANIEELFRRLEKFQAKKDDVVIRQGDPGDFYYLLDKGSVKVTRQMEPGGPEVELAVLGEGTSFGEEALISDNPRNANIIMLEDGELRRLAKQDFVELLKEPMVDWVELNDALVMLGDEAQFLDVRVIAEYNEGHLPSAIDIPLYELRNRLGELDTSVHYICYCSSGRRSSAAAFLLKQNGFQSTVLKGGLREVPASFILT